MKKALSLILTFVIVLGMIPMATLPAFAETNVVEVWNDNEGDTSKVTFASLIGTTLAASTTYKLMEDIDLGDYQIKDTTAITLANGAVIDGQGHTLTGFILAGGNGVGLFNGNISSGTVSIQNINFGTEADPIVYTHDGGAYAAAGMGLIKATDGNVTVNFNNVDMFINANVKGENWQNHGGFVARNWGALNVENCTVNGTMKGHGQIGGFVGWSSGTRTSTFKNCINNVDLSRDGSGYFGGFIGLTENATKTTLKFINCVNNGTVNAERQSGGFIGGTSSTIVIENSINTGDVTGTTAVGGFIGNYIHTSITIKNSVNKGTVTATGGHAGGAIGVANATTGNITVSDFFNAGDITSTSSAGGVIGISEPSDDNSAQVIDIDRLINTGTIKGKWRGCAATGYIKNATVSIDNSVSTGSVIKSNDNSTSYAFCENAAALDGNITGSGNYAVNGKTINEAGFTENLGASLETILSVINNADNGFAYGSFALNAAGNNIVAVTPEFEGYQLSAVDADTNTYKVRFLATINDVNLTSESCEYEQLGMQFSNDGGETWGMVGYAEYVYTSVLGNADGSLITYTAESLGGKYIYAFIAEGIDATADKSYVVRTFAIDKDGNTHYGNETTVTLPARANAN